MKLDETGSPLEQFDDLYFAVRRSVKYHDYRQRHFKFWVDAFTFLSIVLGMLTIYLFAYGDKLVTTAQMPMYLKLAPAVAITVINSLILVFRLGDKAQLHMSLRVGFQNVSAYLKNLEVENAITRNAVAEGYKRRAEIEVDEPKILRVLDVRCHNETNQSMGFTHNYYEVRWYQKLFSKYFDIGPIAFKKIEIPAH